MTKDNFRKELMTIAMPVALQSLMLALVGASDALMLGRFSQNAVAAVSLGNQVSFIMNLFIGSVVGGCSVLLTQYYGKKDFETVKRFMAIGVKLCTGLSFIFFLAALLVPEVLMRIYTPDPELIAMGAEYLRVVSWSYLFAGISQVYLMTMKVSGRATMSAVISVMTVVIDMLVDLFLIYGLCGLPRLGVTGCALSTVAVEASALIVCLADSYRGDHIHPDGASFFGTPRVLYKDLAKVALPSLASTLTWGVGYSMRSMIMGHLGNNAVAADSVVAVILELTTCFCKGFSSGAAIMIGHLLGEGKLEEAKATGRRFWKVSLWCGVLNVVLLAAVGFGASAFFILSDEARAIMHQMLIVAIFYLFAYSINTIITCGVFPAGGDTIYDAKSVVFSKWCFSLPLALSGTFLFHWPVMLVYVIVMSDEVVKIPWVYPRYKKYIWVRKLTRENV